MNVKVPGESESLRSSTCWAFMVVVLVGMLAFFRRRGFL
jgi:Mg2+ and Co2+ transporter CorA